MAFAYAVGLVGSPSACRRPPSTSPEQLQRDWQVALERNDPKAAYALLHPELRAALPWAEFEVQWQDLAEERSTMLRTLAEDGLRNQPALRRQAITQHGDGLQLTWRLSDHGWVVIGGLPSHSDLSTPERTIRSLVAAMREMESGPVARLLDAEAREVLSEQWRARAGAIESALNQPGALQVDGDRATLRYGELGLLQLRRDAARWWVVSFE